MSDIEALSDTMKEALSYVREAVIDELQAEWNDRARTANIKTIKDETGSYLDPQTSDEFRTSFREEFTADALLDKLKTSQEFLDAVNNMLETFSNEAEFDSDSGDDYEPDWEALEEMRERPE